MSSPQLPARQSQHLPARRRRRRATTMDYVRARELMARIDRGESEIDAYWAVASDPGIGFSRYRGATERPAEIVLRRKLAALLERTVPHVVESARNFALAKLAGLSDDAVRAVEETITGQITDGRIARARLDGAKTVLGSLGIGERAAPMVATQVNFESPAPRARTLADLVNEP